jgi:hypothetical protein
LNTLVTIQLERIKELTTRSELYSFQEKTTAGCAASGKWMVGILNVATTFTTSLVSNVFNALFLSINCIAPRTYYKFAEVVFIVHKFVEAV